MRAVVQRVLRAAVHIGGREHARVERGLLVLLGVETGDTEADAEWLCGKIACMRVFADAEGVHFGSCLAPEPTGVNEAKTNRQVIHAANRRKERVRNAGDARVLHLRDGIRLQGFQYHERDIFAQRLRLVE